MTSWAPDLQATTQADRWQDAAALRGWLSPAGRQAGPSFKMGASGRGQSFNGQVPLSSPVAGRTSGLSGLRCERGARWRRADKPTVPQRPRPLRSVAVSGVGGY